MAGYVIQVGNERPGEAIVATPNKKTGEPQGPQLKTYIRVGAHLLLNRARVWGRRVINGKAKDDGSQIEFNTVGYTGELEFLDWGKEGGYAIDVRYLPQSRSLDFEYQNNVQKITINQEQEGVHITLKAGENKFDTNKEAVLIQFLKVHPQNRNSKSKNPNPSIKNFGYYEVTDEHVDQKAVGRIETAIEAGLFVKQLSSKPEQVKSVFQILGNRDEFGNTDMLSGDAQIYKTLLEYASANSEDFFALIADHKKGIEEDFSKAKSYSALDLTKDGHIAIRVGDKSNLILSNIKAKGDGMIGWVLDHYHEEEVYKATQILKELVSKLK
jgi:hypothetical protein